jgi:SsrA-binding protein
MFDEGRSADRGHLRSFSPARPAIGDNGPMSKLSKGKSGKDKAKAAGGTIALNKRARHEYHLEQRIEAGLALQGWELKSIRAGRANIGEAYAVIRGGEMFLFNAQITPLLTASTHVVAEERRTRKLLMHRDEIDGLIGRIQREGYTVVPTALYWKGNKVKAEVALAKGKKEHDKRDASKERDWQREKQRTMRAHNKNA